MNATYEWKVKVKAGSEFPPGSIKRLTVRADTFEKAIAVVRQNGHAFNDILRIEQHDLVLTGG